jgi:hypothetical protein
MGRDSEKAAAHTVARMSGLNNRWRLWAASLLVLSAAAPAFAAEGPDAPAAPAESAPPAAPALVAEPPAAPGAAAAPAAPAVSAVSQRWSLGGTGGWDYLTLEPSRHRLFVARADRVEVVDTATGRVAATIPGTEGAHGVAIARSLGVGYVSDGRSDSITVFDLDTLVVRQTVKLAGRNPDAIVYEPVRRRVLVFDGGSHDAVVLDAATLQVLATLPLPDKPEFALADGDGAVYVNIESDTGQLLRIGGETPAVEASWTLDGCENPTGLALDRSHRRLFSTCSNGVMAVTDGRDGRALARVPIGAHPDAAAFDEASGAVFSSNGEGTVTVVRRTEADGYEAAASLRTEPGARTMALDAAAGRIFLVTADFDPPPAAPDGATAAPARPQAVAGTARVLVVPLRLLPSR